MASFVLERYGGTGEGCPENGQVREGGLVEYGDIQGYFPLRKQLSSHLFKSAQMEVSPNQILTSLGATQALDLALRLLVKPGDHVLVDEPCNGNLIKLVRVHGGVPVGLPRSGEGPDIEVLDALLSRCKIKAFFCNTTYHNPTGGGLSPRGAFGVLKRAIEHDFVIVEDDVYGDFYPGVRQTFAQLDGFDRVLYVGSFSKSLSASLRIGYIISPPGLVDSLVELKMLTSVAVPGFCERFVNTILSDGTYLKHSHAIQRQLMTQQKLAQSILRKYGWCFDIEPDGGMFLWVRHPALNDLGNFIASLERKRVSLLPGSAFSISRDFRDRTRINVSLLNDDVGRFLDVERRGSV
ncbi:MAG: PLP-dependent aminotransferase family protein [Lautropia sp.]|nr:PLP-dependent aminotransferase family protein [Lautropia sp.]